MGLLRIYFTPPECARAYSGTPSIRGRPRPGGVALASLRPLCGLMVEGTDDAARRLSRFATMMQFAEILNTLHTNLE